MMPHMNLVAISTNKPQAEGIADQSCQYGANHGPYKEGKKDVVVSLDLLGQTHPEVPGPEFVPVKGPKMEMGMVEDPGPESRRPDGYRNHGPWTVDVDTD